MQRKIAIGLALLLAICLLAGCTAGGESDTPIETVTPPSSEPATQPPTQPPTEPETVPETTAPNTITSYQISIRSPKLAVHSGPGYGYSTVSYITDQGTYTIVAHENEALAEGQETVWGKLESGTGWINLDDALAGDEFVSYLVKIKNPCLEIYSGPGYGYGGVDTITDQGTYTIVEESIQYFSSGKFVTWGKLKSGVGWICLDDANLVTDMGPPYRCTECGRADVSISRYGLCDACYKKENPTPYGTCAVCYEALTYDEFLKNDGFVCNDCLVCGWCGKSISIMDVAAYSTYMCKSCWESYCHACGADCSDSGTVDGLCKDCRQDLCTICGTQLHEGNTAYNGFGKCEDCYYATLDPAYICKKCGVDCSFRGIVDGLCEDCAAGKCDMCGGPLGDNHNCDDYPNVFCPNCDWSMHTTGVGLDGFTCPDCGTHFMP